MTVATLNSTIRLMDRERGEMLQKFTGHRGLNYRSQASMSYDEAQVLAGDEDGLLWAWDLESVGQISFPKDFPSLYHQASKRLIMPCLTPTLIDLGKEKPSHELRRPSETHYVGGMSPKSKLFDYSCCRWLHKAVESR